MSRSMRKTAVFSYTGAASDRPFKQQAAQRRRAKHRTTWGSRPGDDEESLAGLMFDTRAQASMNRADSLKRGKRYQPATRLPMNRRPVLAK